ncbi:MAG TPA: hypothetical protein VIU12_26970 [Chryseolinea sp.]
MAPCSRCIFFLLLIFIGCKHDTVYINNVPVDLKHVDSTYTTLFADSNFLYTDPQVPFNGKRLIYIHGGVKGESNHLASLMNSPGNINLVDSLNALGWQVLEFDLPNKKVVSDYWSDGGEAYAQAYLSKLNQVVKWSELELGHADDYCIGGVSFGGLHALYGEQHFPIFKKYFALLPVTKLNILKEFAHYDSVPAFDPTREYKKLAKAEGFLFWNTSDSRVGFLHTQKMYTDLKNIQAPIDSLTAPSGGHSLPDNLDFVIRFLQH